MATVAFTVPSAPSTNQVLGRKQVTILEAGGISDPITLPITSPKVEITPGLTDWQTVPRSARLDLLLPRGMKLTTMKMTVQVVGASPDDAAGCEAVLDQLALLARARGLEPLAVNYGTFESSGYLIWQGNWRMTGCLIKSEKRQPGTNSIVWAEVDLTFTEASDVPFPAVLPSQTVAPAKPVAAPTKGTPASRTYTVHSGDTLWAISVKFYGTGIQWTAIASANNLNDARTLQPGQVLKIP